MKALITAAGRGTRLKEITLFNNKCLLKIGDKGLLEHSVAILKKNMIENIYIITGHYADKIESTLNKEVTCIFNPFYNSSGILISLWLAREYLYGEEFIFLTGDVLYDPDILERLLREKEGNIICVDKKKSYTEEASKVIVKNDRIFLMGKDLPLQDVNAEFGHIARFSKQGSKRLFDKINQFLRQERLNTYLMDVLNELINEGTYFFPFDITGHPRIEIDVWEDLEEARAKIYPLIADKLNNL